MPRTVRFVRIRPQARLRAQIPCPRDDLRKLSKVRCEGVGFHAHAPSGARHGLPARASAGRWFKCSRSLHALGCSPARRARTEVLYPLHVRTAALPLCLRAQAQRSRTALSRCCHTAVRHRVDAAPGCSFVTRGQLGASADAVVGASIKRLPAQSERCTDRLILAHVEPIAHAELTPSRGEIHAAFA